MAGVWFVSILYEGEVICVVLASWDGDVTGHVCLCVCVCVCVCMCTCVCMYVGIVGRWWHEGSVVCHICVVFSGCRPCNLCHVCVVCFQALSHVTCAVFVVCFQAQISMMLAVATFCAWPPMLTVFSSHSRRRTGPLSWPFCTTLSCFAHETSSP